MKIRIYYEDTDCMGVVYHANYLKFCERARSEIFHANKIKIKDKNFVVKKIIAHYIVSARLGETLEVETKIIEIKKASCTIEHFIYREGKIIFKAVVSLAFLNLLTQKIEKIDQKIMEVLKCHLIK